MSDTVLGAGRAANKADVLAYIPAGDPYYTNNHTASLLLKLLQRHSISAVRVYHSLGCPNPGTKLNVLSLQQEQSKARPRKKCPYLLRCSPG